ncbi:hypothetical protein BJP36_40500 [Moorena producens JHB]|uniref:Uncharacterized protein n=1 Tax=Moorena producens (strain JHB) TaxID=1454205 RepID=A0A9Q9SS54_MOOP1|nr:hypothetical protein [Moorena producens]WAN68652.1 hypothetical protein BJP36_40500 [Moorena producens JHB]
MCRRHQTWWEIGKNHSSYTPHQITLAYWPRVRVQPTLLEDQRRTTLAYWPRDRVQPTLLEGQRRTTLAYWPRVRVQPSTS